MSLALLALLTTAPAATLTVCTGGSCAFSNLGAAIASAQPADEIVVGDGTWTVVSTIDKDLTIRAQNPGYAFIEAAPYSVAFQVSNPVDFVLEDLEFGAATGSRILDATAAADITMARLHATDHNPEGHLVKIQAGGTLTVTDSEFTGFMHGNAVDGAVFWIGGGGTALLDRVAIRDATAWQGGAIHVSDGTLTFRYSSLDNSSALTHGGGIFVAGLGTLIVEDSSFTNNSTDGAGGHIFCNGVCSATRSTFEAGQSTGLLEAGGALYGVQTIDECEFLDNHAVYGGGAVYTEGGTILKSTFTANTSDRGGAIWFSSVQGPLSILESRFDTNATTPGAGGYGGAVNTYWGGDIDIRDSVFTNNTADVTGGGVYHGGPGDVVVDNCLFDRNHAPDGGGGGLASFYNDQTVLVHQSTFTNNDALNGGAFEGLGGGAMMFTRSVFCGNSSTSYGGALNFNESGYVGTAAINNSVFFQNLGGYGSTIDSHSGISLIQLYNNDLLDNDGVQNGGSLAIWQNAEVDVRNNLIAWSDGALGAYYVEQTTGPLTQDYNAFWQNAPSDLGGSDADYGAHPVLSDPMLTDFVPGATTCGSWNLEPQPGSELLDGGDPSWTDTDGSDSDIGITGGVDGTTAPGYIPPSSTGTGTGTGAGTGTGTGGGGTSTGTWTAPWPTVDEDGDGWSPPEDCDDHAPQVHPGARELPNDRKDNDCDGEMLQTWLGGRACDSGAGAPGLSGWLLIPLILARRRRG